MSDSEEELDGGTLPAAAVQQPAVKQEEEEEEELDGGVIGPPPEEEEEELDGGVLAEADLYEESDPCYAAATAQPSWAPPGKQGGQVVCVKRGAGEGARVSEGKRFRAEEAEARLAAPKAAPKQELDALPPPQMRFVSGNSAAAEAEASFGSTFGSAGLQGGPEGRGDAENRGGGLGSGGGGLGSGGGGGGGWDEEEMDSGGVGLGGGGGGGGGGDGGWDEEEMDRGKDSGGGGGGTMAERMMAKMGYVAGGGLGKHGEGRAEAILDRGNVGALGLGYAVKGLTDTASTMPEPLSAEEEIEMPAPDWIELSAPALPVPEAEELAGWAEEGGRVESIDDETGFVDGEILREMLSAKNVLDEIQDRRAFDDARNRANPFEGVRKEFFINRAAAKMAAMDAACGWIFSYADAEDPAREGTATSNSPDAPFGTAPRPAPSLLHFGDVAAGPGGFSEYLLWRRGGSACGVGFTLRGDHDFTLQRFHYKALPELFHPYYGPKDDGDLYQSSNLRALQALVGRQTAGVGLHVVMGDGGFDVSGAENIQEVLNKQLLLMQFASALGCLAEGGHFVCKAFDLFTPFSAGLLYVMYRCFDAVCVYKPAASRPANSERYIICRGLRRANPPAFEYLLTVNDRLNVLKRAWRSSGQKEGDGGQDVTGLAPAALLGMGTPFGSYLADSNNRLGRLQAKALRRLVAMLRNPGERCGDQTATREACLTAWRLPADVPPVTEHPDIETFYLREVGADDMPRAVEAQPVRGRDFDPESVTAKLRRAEDWVCVESSAEKPVLMLGADGEGRRGLVFTWDANHSTWQLRQEMVLPRGTLLLVEMVAEQTEQGGFQARRPLPSTQYPVPSTHCPLPAACRLLPAACRPLPTAAHC